MKKSIIVSFMLLGWSLVFAQDPQLFENVWFNTQITISGTTYSTPSNTEVPFVSLEFDKTGSTFQTKVCNEGSGTVMFDSNNPGIMIIDIGVTLIQCQDASNNNYDVDYFNFFALGETDPFVFEITSGSSGNKTLVITSANGDSATYTNESLSIRENQIPQVSITPNPFNTTVQIEANTSLSNIIVHNVLGQVVFSKKLDNSQTTVSLDLAHLNSGVYFALVEDGIGNRAARRLVKE